MIIQIRYRLTKVWGTLDLLNMSAISLILPLKKKDTISKSFIQHQFATSGKWNELKEVPPLSVQLFILSLDIRTVIENSEFRPRVLQRIRQRQFWHSWHQPADNLSTIVAVPVVITGFVFHVYTENYNGTENHILLFTFYMLECLLL